MPSDPDCEWSVFILIFFPSIFRLIMRLSRLNRKKVDMHVNVLQTAIQIYVVCVSCSVPVRVWPNSNVYTNVWLMQSRTSIREHLTVVKLKQRAPATLRIYENDKRKYEKVIKIRGKSMRLRWKSESRRSQTDIKSRLCNTLLLSRKRNIHKYIKCEAVAIFTNISKRRK